MAVTVSSTSVQSTSRERQISSTNAQTSTNAHTTYTHVFTLW